jgi:hypothetical protein
MMRRGLLVSVPMTNHVNYYRARQNEYGNLTLWDIHAVSIGPCEPFFRNRRHHLVTPMKGVIHIQKITLRFQVIRTGHVHGELATKERKQMFLNYCAQLPVAINLIRRSS